MICSKNFVLLYSNKHIKLDFCCFTASFGPSDIIDSCFEGLEYACSGLAIIGSMIIREKIKSINNLKLIQAYSSCQTCSQFLKKYLSYADLFNKEK